MKRVRQDVWVTDDGAKWFSREEAVQRDRLLRLNKLFEPYCYDTEEQKRVVDAVMLMLADGRLILPPAVARQSRLL